MHGQQNIKFMSVSLSISLSAFIRAVPIARIGVQFDIDDFCVKLS